jgi:hypothetical protein
MRGAINALPCTVTVAPGTPPPEESVTVPAIFPVIATCARQTELQAARLKARDTATNNARLRNNLEKYEDRICSLLQSAQILD